MEPSSLYFPPRMRQAHAGLEGRSVRDRDLVLVPGADQRRLYHFAAGDERRYIEERSEAKNIVPPEDRLQLPEIGLGQIGTLVHRAIIDPSNCQRKRVRFRRDDQVGAQTSKFSGEAVAHFKRHGQSCRCHGHAYDKRRGRQHLAARIADEGLAYQAGKHARSESSRWLRRAPKDRRSPLPLTGLISRG